MTKIRKIGLFAIGLGLCLLLLLYGLRLYINDHQNQLFGEVISRVETQQKVIALTFDDGPKPKRTERILKILDDENIKATFFLNGKLLKKYKSQSMALVESGHQLANHSYNHDAMVFVSYDHVAEEIESTTKILRGYGYEGELHFRPPFGKSFFNLSRYLENNSIKTIAWDVEPETWGDNRADAQEQVKRALEQTKPGSIIIMHVMFGDEQSITAAPMIIKELKAQGYRFVTVDELLSLNG